MYVIVLGLTIDEREIIENAYRANVIRVIVCTSTLSSGVIIKMICDVVNARWFA